MRRSTTSLPRSGPRRISSTVAELHPGSVVWIDLGRTTGREQSGRRPGVVVSGPDYLRTVDTLALVVPLTKRDRGWQNHVRVRGETGLTTQSWAMTEQVRAIARERLLRTIGTVSGECLADIRTWLTEHLDLAP